MNFISTLFANTLKHDTIFAESLAGKPFGVAHCALARACEIGALRKNALASKHFYLWHNAVSKTENDVFSEKDFTTKAGNRFKLSLVF